MSKVVLFWVWFCAYLNCAGWMLSALHQLNAGGYAAVLLVGLAALFLWWKNSFGPLLPPVHWGKLRRRFRRPFPLAFLILAAMAFGGSALHAPTNYDGLTYRVPRILHWLADDRWHWIHTMFPRVNARACGIEWVSTPMITLLKTDRLLFLINIVSFLLLPGLMFSVFTRLGVRRRVAWPWMWLVPTGYCFLLQAGSIGNDLFGAPFALAAIDFALRAKVSRAPCDFFASVLAAALMTSAKTSDLPLLLPWAVAVLPSLYSVLRRPLATAAVCVIATFASFLPTAVLNAHFCGDWTGWNAESQGVKNAPMLRMVSYPALLTVQNLTPPIFPLAGAWNQEVLRLIPAALNSRLHAAVVEPQAAEFRAEEMQMEESAGLGFGVTLLLLISVLVATRRSGTLFSSGQSKSPEAGWQTAIRVAPWISLMALLSQTEVSPIGRIVAPYYPLLVPLLLTGYGHGRLVARRWWRVSAGAVFLMAAGLLIVSPARPLFPVGIFLKKVHATAAQHPVLARVEAVYSVYRNRSDAFAPVREVLPPDVKVLGLITYDDPETSLWRPFGSRRIEHVCPQDTPAELKQRGVEYVLVSEELLGPRFQCSLDDWLRQMNGRVMQKIPLYLRAAVGPTDWYLVQLQ
ncbi:MAG: hypothetical protein ACLQAH_14450 [Limisphaerales bacterium]